jgi:hypothetical protein
MFYDTTYLVGRYLTADVDSVRVCIVEKKRKLLGI